MKHIEKRVLSMLCAVVMVLSLAAMIVPGAQATTPNEIDAIPSEHLASVRDYSYFAYDANEGTNYVDDAEAYNGKAVCFSRANLGNEPGLNSMTFVTLHHYYGPDNSIGNLFQADLKINQGYQVYKFTYDVPADVTDGGVIYLIPNWQLNSSQLSKDLYAYAGKTVEIYLSMKVAGPADDGYYSVSVDRVALESQCKDYANEDGTACTQCGAALEPEEEVTALTFLADDITRPMAAYDSVVEDSDSEYGKAVMLSAGIRANASPDTKDWLYNMMFYTDGKTLPIYASDNTVHNMLGSITDEQFQANAAAGQYVTYTFSNLDLSGMTFFYTFDWTVRIDFTKAHQDFLQGRKVDLNISLKATGDVTGADTTNLPCYYIDCISFTAAGEEHTHSCTGYTYVDENEHSGICTGCGEVFKAEHTWDEGVVTVEPTEETLGEKTYTCTVCNGTKTELLEKVEQSDALVFLADDITLPMHASGYDAVVADSDSVYGKAIKLSAENRVGDAWLYNMMFYPAGSGKTLPIYANNGADVLLGSLTDVQIQQNAAAGQYVTYTFNDLDLSGMTFMYTFDWTVRINFTQEHQDFLQGKKVSMTVSLKATGDVTGADTGNLPCYYIDCITIAEAGAVHTHTCDSYTYLNEVQHTGICSGCGETLITAHVWDDGVITVAPTVDAEGEKTYTCTVCNGTKTQILGKLDANDPFTDLHIVSVRDYSYFATQADVETSYVDDDEAFGGKAVCYAQAKLTEHPSISINRYDVASGLADGAEELKIGSLNLGELMLNSGYHTYKFTYKVPEATTEGNVFYIMSNWQLNSAQFCKDFAPYAGKTMEVYISMKVTGPAENGLYAVSVDRVALATSCLEYANEDGTACTLCGKAFEEESLLPMTIRAYDFTLPYSSMGCDAVVTDPDSKYGVAVRLSYEERAATGDQGLLNSLIRTDGLSVGLHTYNGSDSANLGRITAKQLQKNSKTGKYVTYGFWNIPLVPAKGDVFMYLFDCWGVQYRFDANEMEALRGKRVDVTVSMKVTGNVAGSPTYYIDYIEIAEASGKQCSHEDCSFTDVDENNHNFACAICGASWDAPHRWNNGVAIEGTIEGLKKFSCTGCGRTSIGPDAESEAGKAICVFLAAEDITLPYSAAPFGCDRLVNDPDAAFGNAAMFSYAARYATGDKGLYSAVIRTDEQVLGLYTYNGKDEILLGEITSQELQKNAAAGGYALYTFKNVDATSADFVYMFNCWGLQARFSDDQKAALQDKKVDVTVSMKVEGDVTGADTANPPVYYIAYIAFTEAAQKADHTHICDSYTALDDMKHTGICTECGEELTEYHKWDDGEVITEPTTEHMGQICYTCTTCGETKTNVIEKLAAGVDEGEGFNNSAILIWAIAIGLSDLAIIIFIIYIIKKRKK